MKYCSKCGEKLNEGNTFCTNCGFKVLILNNDVKKPHECEGNINSLSDNEVTLLSENKDSGSFEYKEVNQGQVYVDNVVTNTIKQSNYQQQNSQMYNQSGYQQNNQVYTQNGYQRQINQAYSPNSYQQYNNQNQTHNQDIASSMFFGVIGTIIPWLGFLLYLLLNKNYQRFAKYSLIGGCIGTVIYMFVIIIWTIID